MRPTHLALVLAVGLVTQPMTAQEWPFGGPGPDDCSMAATRPDPIYDPAPGLHTIQVVVHVLQSGDCAQGALSDADVQSQIDALNEDYLALAGTPGAGGAPTGIRFVLASADPDGNPTSGIDRHCNELWYQDDAAYWDSIAWDGLRYLNLYTNTADGARGYVPFLPASGEGTIGSPEDRVVINTLAFGRQDPPPVPHHAGGRTATHEIGHYLGLFHTFYDGCGVAASPGCYESGDRICDTPPDAAAQDVCPVGATSCGGFASSVENYMQYTDDPCMTGFTHEQGMRMRCTLMHYRPGLIEAQLLFRDDLETGNLDRWSSATP